MMMKVTAPRQTDQVNDSQTELLNNGKNAQSPSVEKKERHDCRLALEEYHSDFTHEYLFGERQRAFELLPFIDPNYDDGYFLIITARKADTEMVGALLERGAKASIQDALAAAAFNKDDKGCIDLLIKKGGANPLLFQGTTAAFHPVIKAYLTEANHS
jgi:hypothetical protein